MKKTPAVLIIENDRSCGSTVVELLREKGYRVARYTKAAHVMPAIVRHRPSVILLDIELPDSNGVDVLKEIKREYEDIPVIMITGVGTVENAVVSMKEGAYDFLEKPLHPTRLEIEVRNAVRLYDSEARYLAMAQRRKFYGMISISRQMDQVYRVITNVATTDATVLITGESGTGKELVARSIYELSRRRGKPFIAINCAAIPRQLLESELFGHEKGAFTGAVSRHIGCCEAANGGTLFLDEICEMSPDLQAKLLRFLQDLTFQRVGGTETLTADVRLIAATNKDPLKEVEKGNFREDLYYRLMVVPIDLPPLRERKGDIRFLANYFLQKFSKQHKKRFRTVSEEAEEAMLSYRWPGNVRELENVIEGAIVLEQGPTLTLEHLPPRILRSARQASPSSQQERVRRLSEIVKDAIREALATSNGDVTVAARQLELPEEAVREKAKELHLKGGW